MTQTTPFYSTYCDGWKIRTYAVGEHDHGSSFETLHCIECIGWLWKLSITLSLILTLMLMLTMMLMLTKKARDNQHLLCKNCSKQGQGRVANNWKRYFWANSQRTSQKHKKYVWINLQWTHSKCKTHWRWRQPTIPFNGDDCFENHRKIAIVR